MSEDSHKASQARYRASEKGRAVLARYRAKYGASEVGKAAKARYRTSENGKAARAKYAASEKGKASRVRYEVSEKNKARSARYRASENGRLAYVKCHAHRHCPAPDRYAASFKRLLLEEHKPCALCGKAWELSHQLDHIVPLGLGGKDEESNYQVLCVDCHTAKNHEDMRKMWAARRQQSVKETA